MVQGSAGDAGTTQASTSLTRCDRALGTAALIEADGSVITLLNTVGLQSPLPVVQLMMQQSGCFTVLERGSAIAAIEAEQQRSGKMVRLKAADYMVKPNIIFSNPDAGGYGGLASVGSIFGPVGTLVGAAAGSIKMQEAQTLLTLVDVETGVQLAAAEGSAKVQDFGGLGGLGGFGGGLFGLAGVSGYGNTAEGKLIVAALMDAHNKLVGQVRGRAVATGQATSDLGPDSAIVQEVQAELKARGLYPSRLDGKVGPGTRAAIMAYQESQGLPADGQPSRRPTGPPPRQPLSAVRRSALRQAPERLAREGMRLQVLRSGAEAAIEGVRLRVAGLRVPPDEGAAFALGQLGQSRHQGFPGAGAARRLRDEDVVHVEALLADLRGPARMEEGVADDGTLALGQEHAELGPLAEPVGQHGRRRHGRPLFPLVLVERVEQPGDRLGIGCHRTPHRQPGHRPTCRHQARATASSVNRTWYD